MNPKDYKFSDDEIKEIQFYRDRRDDSRLKMRFIALLLLAGGMDIEYLASEIIGKTARTICNWFDKYISKGIDALNSLDYTPRKSYLNFFQINQIVIWVTFNNPGNIKTVKEYIEEKFGISYCDDAVRKLLKNRGLKWITPEKVPGNPPSVEEQEKFVKEYHEYKESMQPGDAVFFVDAMHLIHQAVPGHCWGDPLFRPVLPTNSGRKRLNILGAYNPVTHSFVHLTGEENCNGDRVVEFLEKTAGLYPDTSLRLYTDQAKYFHAVKVGEWLNTHPKVKIEKIPVYSPNLNLIERFWKFTKGKLVKNKYYEKYKVFRATVFRFLNNPGKYINELRKLMVEEFEIIDYHNANVMP